MRIRSLFVAVVFVFAFVLQSFAQTAVPDYSGWKKISSPEQFTIDGKSVTLKVGIYQDTNQSTLVEHLIIVINNESGEPWIMLYTYLQHTADHKNENKEQNNLFEYQNGKWVHIKDFSDSQDLYKETEEFLKSRYSLGVE